MYSFKIFFVAMKLMFTVTKCIKNVAKDTENAMICKGENCKMTSESKLLLLKCLNHYMLKCFPVFKGKFWNKMNTIGLAQWFMNIAFLIEDLILVTTWSYWQVVFHLNRWKMSWRISCQTCSRQTVRRSCWAGCASPRGHTVGQRSQLHHQLDRWACL